jgi:hypothetical protein
MLQAHGDLVSAVDFGNEFLVAGFEDGSLGVWSLQPIGKVFLLIISTPVCVARARQSLQKLGSHDHYQA